MTRYSWTFPIAALMLGSLTATSAMAQAKPTTTPATVLPGVHKPATTPTPGGSTASSSATGAARMNPGAYGLMLHPQTKNNESFTGPDVRKVVYVLPSTDQVIVINVPDLNNGYTHMYGYWTGTKFVASGGSLTLFGLTSTVHGSTGTFQTLISSDKITGTFDMQWIP